MHVKTKLGIQNTKVNIVYIHSVSVYNRWNYITCSRHGFFISARTNGWVNHRDVGDVRRHCAHYDVTVMPPNVILKWTRHTLILCPYTAAQTILLVSMGYTSCNMKFMLRLPHKRNKKVIKFLGIANSVLFTCIGSTKYITNMAVGDISARVTRASVVINCLLHSYPPTTHICISMVQKHTL